MSAARGAPPKSSTGTTPQRWKYARCAASSSSPVPYTGLRPAAGPIRKIAQQAAISPYVTGADSFRTARAARVTHLPIMRRA
ncbi:hypothetical protein [Streptomyces scabiei]|uniref:hypothetical protein n=1 Tax=Streptomyces scabiei TaxID=1930 RepID=UPI0035AB8C96